jgi:Cdc6-like AAA superfamily ATPase
MKEEVLHGDIKMNWTVLGEKNGRIQLVSKKGVNGLLPKGSYLTVEQGKSKFILRVDDSMQHESYVPSPMLIDMDLQPLKQDQKCQNIVSAYRVKDIQKRTDGLLDYIRPLVSSRRSNQDEVDEAMGNNMVGPTVFPATIHYNQCQLLTDDAGNLITTKLPVDMFFHQMLVCGKTGTGKTVATKYLAQYFVEKHEGAVLAINVKDVDFLKMDQESKTANIEVKQEWDVLNEPSHGIDNFMVYYPANTELKGSKGVTKDIAKKITLNVNEIEPESLTGLLQDISDIGAQHLPGIFRFWKEEYLNNHQEEPRTFSAFVQYMIRGEADGRRYQTLNVRGDLGEITLHKGTFDNILRSLDVAQDFFDNEEAESLNETDILVNGKMSVIDVTGENGIQFGSILLRDLIHRIVKAKSEQRSTVPILIIIDEVHMFYNSSASHEALGDLDVICRTGRSQEIGVIFSSQNPNDIPKGLSSVINTKIFFKSDPKSVHSFGINIRDEELENLKKGYAVASIYDLSQLKILKFPLAFAGVFEKGCDV